MAPHVTLDLYARASGRVNKIEHKAEDQVLYFYQRDRKRVWTNPMLHEEPYINCFVITLRMRKPPRV